MSNLEASRMMRPWPVLDRSATLNKNVLAIIHVEKYTFDSCFHINPLPALT
jgi:hypothetical protein